MKEPQASEVAMLMPHHILFTYLHLAADLALTESLAATGCTGIGYETIVVDFERMRFLDITMSGTSTVYSNDANLSELLPRVDLVIGAELLA